MPEDVFSSLRLGGGTTLAMRWHHRHSTDIDLALDSDLAVDFMRRYREALRDALNTLKSQGAIRRFYVGRQSVEWRYADSGPVSISASRRRYDMSLLDVEAKTCMPLAPTYEILRGKLLGRVLMGNKLLARDGYDLACAFTYDEQAMKRLMDEVHELEPERLSTLTQLIGNAPGRIVLGRPLLNATHNEVAKDPWRAFLEKLHAHFGDQFERHST